MPDFRKAIEDAKFKPDMETISTTGPNATGEEQTWVNPRQQLSQSSAAELAELMGATQSQVRYDAGPFTQNKPQWQIDFSPDKGDEFDAAMVYENYQKRPDSFNAQMADELKIARGPLPPGVERAGNEETWQGPPINPLASDAYRHGGGGFDKPVTGGSDPGPDKPVVDLKPGPKWPDPPPPLKEGPGWDDDLLKVPGPTGVDPVPLFPGTGVKDPGGFKPGGIPDLPGGFPRPIDLAGNAGGELPQSVTPRAYTPRPGGGPGSLLGMPQQAMGDLPSAVMQASGPGGLLTIDELKKRAGGYLPAKYQRGLLSV